MYSSRSKYWIVCLFRSENEMVRKYSANRLILSCNEIWTLENDKNILVKQHSIMKTSHSVHSLWCKTCFLFLLSSEAESAATLCSNVERHYFGSSYFASVCMKDIHFAHKYMSGMTVTPVSPQKHMILPFSLAQLCKSGSASLAPALSHTLTIWRREQPCMLLPPFLWMKKKSLKF